MVQLDQYLQSWGLRHFTEESPYYDWQRSCLTREQLRDLHALVERRCGGRQAGADIDFYDLVAQSPFLPVIYSQRYDYYLTVGALIETRIPDASRVLDFGCGVGVLTLYWALAFPDVEFVGIDRSTQSIAVASREARARHVQNVSFRVGHLPHDRIPGTYDLILSMQAVFQAESHPGLPSRGWQTFQRSHDPQGQLVCEKIVGLHPRLDILMEALRPAGRMIFCEKTGHLGRRILFQRALQRRGLILLREPTILSYQSIDEPVLDGPLFEVGRKTGDGSVTWTEEPSIHGGETLFRCTGEIARSMALALLDAQPFEQCQGKSVRWGRWQMKQGVWNGALVFAYLDVSEGVGVLIVGGIRDQPLFRELFHHIGHLAGDRVDAMIDDVWGNLVKTGREEVVPGYENHHASAQEIYDGLPSKCIEQESTREDPEGRVIHLERGRTENLYYFYWADTFDQRQLIVVEPSQREMLGEYFEESLRQFKT